jgi:hypothetical protein
MPSGGRTGDAKRGPVSEHGMGLQALSMLIQVGGAAGVGRLSILP